MLISNSDDDDDDDECIPSIMNLIKSINNNKDLAPYVVVEEDPEDPYS